MLQRGNDNWGKTSEPEDQPSPPEHENGRSDVSNWAQQDALAASFGAGQQRQGDSGAPGQETLAPPDRNEATGLPAPYPPSDDPSAPYPTDAQDDYAPEDLSGEYEEDDWYEDEEGAGEDEERALAPYDTPQPPVRPGVISAALLHLAGQSRQLARLEPRATGPVIVPGSGKVAKPGSFGHTPFSPRAQRPRPFLMLVSIVLLATLTFISTAWAAAPLDTQYETYSSFTTFAGLQAPVATSQPQYNWYVVRYGDTLQSIADKFKVLPGGILLMNGLQDADQLYIGMSLKIPTSPTYGQGAQVGVVDIPPPPPDKSGNVFGTNPWNSLSGPTDPNNICAPAGNSDTVANRQAFQLVAPNPHATFARGFTWYHNGVDLDNPSGSPILAAQAGLVVFAGWDTLGLGWSVKINHCNGLSTVYGHMLHPPLVKANDYVTVGQQIGQEGSTGDSTGPHLHFMTEWWNKAANPYCFNFQLPPGNTPCTAA